MKPDQHREDVHVPTYSGAVDPDVVDIGQDEQRRFEPPERGSTEMAQTRAAVA